MKKSTAIVTGGTRGLGLALAKKLVANGDTVFAISKTKSHWQQAIEEINDRDHFFLFQVDLTSEAQIKGFFRGTCSENDDIRLLVNNAGYASKLSTVQDESLEEFQRCLNENLASQFLMCKYVLPLLKKQCHGTIINVSSMAGKRAVPNLFGYSASKFGTLALSQCVAKENKAAGIKCISVCPGGMNTKMRSTLFGAEDANAQQSTEYVASVIMDVISDKIKVESGMRGKT